MSREVVEDDGNITGGRTTGAVEFEDDGGQEIVNIDINRERIAIDNTAEPATSRRKQDLDRIANVDVNRTRIGRAIAVELERANATAVVQRELIPIDQARRTARRNHDRQVVGHSNPSGGRVEQTAVLVEFKEDIAASRAVVQSERLAIDDQVGRRELDQESTVKLELCRRGSLTDCKGIAFRQRGSIRRDNALREVVTIHELEDSRLTVGVCNCHCLARRNRGTRGCDERQPGIELDRSIIDHERVAVFNVNASHRAQLGPCREDRTDIHLASGREVEPQSQILASGILVQRDPNLTPVGGSSEVEQWLHLERTNIVQFVRDAARSIVEFIVRPQQLPVAIVIRDKHAERVADQRIDRAGL